MSLDPEALRSGGEQDYPAYLLQENQVASEQNVALFKAALNGSVGECERLLSKGAKPNFFYRPEDQKNALHVAAENGFTDVCKVLLKNGAEVNSVATTDQASALTLAAHNDDPVLVRLLLDAGAHINHGNGYGNTALHEACRVASGATIRCLLESGADINIRNHKGSTPLHVFCYGDAVDAHGKHGAKDRHTEPLCRMLLEKGADLHARDARGATPLLVCCTSGRVDLIELFVGQGADLHVVDGKGQGAQDIAVFHDQEAVCKYLASHGAK